MNQIPQVERCDGQSNSYKQKREDENERKEMKGIGIGIGITTKSTKGTIFLHDYTK